MLLAAPALFPGIRARHICIIVFLQCASCLQAVPKMQPPFSIIIHNVAHQIHLAHARTVNRLKRKAKRYALAATIS